MSKENFSFDSKFISRGEVWYILSKNDTVGSEQKSGRPAVVVSNNKGNEHSPIVEICYLTLQDKNPLPTHFELKGGPCFNSTVLCEQITTVSKERFGDFIYKLPDSEMDEIDKRLLISLGIEYLAENKPVSKPTPTRVTETSGSIDLRDKEAEIKELKCQNDELQGELNKLKILCQELSTKAENAEMFERMYNNILDKLVGR